MTGRLPSRPEVQVPLGQGLPHERTQVITAPPSALVDEFAWAPVAGMRRQPPWLVIVAVVLVVMSAGFFVLRSPSSAEAVSLRYAFPLGTTRSYDVTMSVDAKPEGADAFKGTMRATVGYKVVEEKEDGSAVLDMTFTGVTFEPSIGQPVPDGSIRMRIAPDGRVTSAEGSGGLFGAAGAAFNPPAVASGGSPTDAATQQFMFPQFPSDAIKPGDEWDESSTFPLPFGGKQMTITAKGRHDGYEDTSFGRAARIHYTVDAPLDLSFTFAELAGQLAAAGTQVPPGMANAQVTFKGFTKMDADSLVLTDATDVVELDGKVEMSMRISLSGVPQTPGGPPSNMKIDMTMDLKMVRVA